MLISPRSALRRTVVGVFALVTLFAASSFLALHGLTQEIVPGSGTAAIDQPVVAVTPTPTPTNVKVSGAAAASNGTYGTVQLAFAAINGQTQTGNNIAVSIDLDTTETVSAVLNDKGWTSLTITPSGARKITGSNTGALIDLDTADNVTINGLNAGGNSLTISNTSTSSTASTIRFTNAASHNTVTNATVLGSFGGSVSSAGGTILFDKDGSSGNGNDNNTISNNNLGPAGANLPAKAISCVGNISSLAQGNSNNAIDNNNIYDFFGSTSSAGVYIDDGCNTFSITNNRFYQTAQRGWTASTGSQHSAIWTFSGSSTGAQGFTISGNIIGYANSSQTGTYSVSVGGSSTRFVGISFTGYPSGAANTISDNTIAAISVTGISGSGTGTSTPFSAIVVSDVKATTNGNVIGGTAAANALTFSTTTNSNVDVYGILRAGNSTWTANLNSIAGLSVAVTGIGTVATSGLRGNGGAVLSAAGNTIAKISSPGTVNGVQMPSGTGSVIDGNRIYDLASTASSSTVSGIAMGGGTATFKNNMIELGDSVSVANQVNGIQETAGTDNYYHNSVYIGGSPSSGGVNSFAFSSSVSGNTRIIRDNIFVNARSNTGTATGKNYAVQVGGAGQNPTGLTINNNYFYANGAGGKLGLYNGVDAANLAAWKTSTGQDAGSFEGDPLFIDPANAASPDLHLKQLSPAINNGVNASVASDIDGDARPLYTTNDIGADEVVDTTAPETTITSSPAATSASTSATFAYTGNDTGPASGLALSFECSLDAAVFATCPSTYTGLASGSHTFLVRATDGAGNVDATPASYSWTVDATPPDTLIDGNGPADPTNYTSATFLFHGSDAGTGVASFECVLDGGSYATCSSPISYTGLAEGSHTFGVRAKDGVGNIDQSPASFSWVVDTTAPVIAAFTTLPSSASNADRNLNVSVTDGVDVSSVLLEYSVDNVDQPPVDCGLSGSCVIPGQPTGSVVKYYIHASDSAGNTADAPSSSTPDVYTIGAAEIPGGTFAAISAYGGSTFSDDVSVSGTLDLEGIVSVAGGKTLEIGCNALVTNAGDSSYVIGNIRKDICVAGAFSFPTGTAANGAALASSDGAITIGPQPEYSPLTINVTAVNGVSSLTVSTTDSTLSGVTASTGVSRYWTLTESGDITADLTFTYLDEDIHGDENGYQIYRRENGSDTPLGGSLNAASNTITISGVSSFSDWGIGTALSPTGAEVALAGRIVSTAGTGVSDARITVVGTASGMRFETLAGPLGYFRIDGLSVGETYVVTVSSKRFTFALSNKVLTLNESADDLIFTADQ